MTKILRGDAAPEWLQQIAKENPYVDDIGVVEYERSCCNNIIAFYGSSLPKPGQPPPTGHPDIWDCFEGLSREDKIRGTLVPLPEQYKGNQLLLDVDTRGGVGVPCRVGQLKADMLPGVLRVLDRWVGIGVDKNSPFKRETVRLRSGGSAWAWVADLKRLYSLSPPPECPPSPPECQSSSGLPTPGL